MANHAAFDFGFVLVDEWSLLFGVALVTDFIARSVGAQLFRPEGTVRIVAVTALNQALVHTVMKRAGKLGANIAVAAVTQFR